MGKAAKITIGTIIGIIVGFIVVYMMGGSSNLKGGKTSAAIIIIVIGLLGAFTGYWYTRPKTENNHIY